MASLTAVKVKESVVREESDEMEGHEEEDDEGSDKEEVYTPRTSSALSLYALSDKSKVMLER